MNFFAAQFIFARLAYSYGKAHSIMRGDFMEYDESKKLEVEVSENEFVENRVVKKRKRMRLDVLDIAIIPVAIGVFVSLGFLFANLFKATAAVDAMNSVASVLSAIG